MMPTPPLWAKHWRAGAKGAESAVIITLGTGVGGGVVLGGKLLTGYTGAAAEPGHMVILDTPDAPRCTCGRPGCLESLASATALIRMTKEAMAAHPESALHGIAAQSGGVNGRTAFDAAAQGDAAGKAVVEQYIHYLAVGVANMINIFFPEVIGLSGGVANQGKTCWLPCAPRWDQWFLAMLTPKSTPALPPASSATAPG